MTACKRPAALAVMATALLCVPATAAADEIDFEQDIAPILEERCWHCHGEDEAESGLRLDLRSRMLRGGDSGLPAIVPGHPEKSYLIDVISHRDPDVKMPPDEDRMPDAEISLLTRWIKAGAVWPGQMADAPVEVSDHWAFQPVTRPAIPNIDDPAAKVRPQPIDAFLLKALHEKKLSFSEPADPRSLIRRVSIVLIGLAPTPEETDSFVAAFASDPESAWLELVDRLLASPHFGKRWAQHWLDVIRWAETNGSESNLYRKNAWIYRDYVVRAFNEDKPYDQFVREQLAGDSMGTGEATGFLVAGPHVPAATVGREPAAIRQARADRMDEILQTVGASMMGVTIGCARCHNHKFDPITITDYYAMSGVFQDVEFGSRFPELSPEHPRRKRGQTLRREIAKQRNMLRKTGGWEEHWGAYRELHFRPITTTAVRFRFKTPSVTLDELEVFGPEAPRENLAHRRRGTTVSGFPEKGIEDRNPVDRVNDGEYGTMTWRASVPKKSAEQPWVRFDFDGPQHIDRVRLSNNREYFYDTDYLEKKPNVPRYEYDMDIMKSDGTWQPWTGTWVINKKLAETHPERRAILKEVQRLIDVLL